MTPGSTASRPPILTVVIGANGAGKTTWGRTGRNRLPKPFYNADLIAEGLGDPNSAALQAQARKIVDQAIEQHLGDQSNFGFESTYSGSSRPAIVRRAKTLGYVTAAFFIGTAHHRINIARVRKRVEEGGHDVPANEIIRRWTAAQDNLLTTWSSFDTITIIDNSGEQPAVVANRSGLEAGAAGPALLWIRDLLTRRTRPGRKHERD